MDVVWDEKKRLLTIAKHDIDFIDAAEIFRGIYLVLDGRSEVEERKRAVAFLGVKAICVAFTIRDETIRIITARVARRNEREQYQALYSRRIESDEGPDELGSAS